MAQYELFDIEKTEEGMNMRNGDITYAKTYRMLRPIRVIEGYEHGLLNALLMHLDLTDEQVVEGVQQYLQGRVPFPAIQEKFGFKRKSQAAFDPRITDRQRRVQQVYEEQQLRLAQQQQMAAQAAALQGIPEIDIKKQALREKYSYMKHIEDYSDEVLEELDEYMSGI